MVDVKHPDDARAHSAEPPCAICGQPEKGHPDVDGFHKFVPPANAEQNAPTTPAKPVD